MSLGIERSVDAPLKPKGWQLISDLSAAIGLTVPYGAEYALLQPETQAVRFRDDGTDASATVGMVIAANEKYLYKGDLSAISFFEDAASASLNVLFYAAVEP